MKAAVLFLVVFGLLLMIASRFFGGVVILLLGLAMLGGGLFLGFRPCGILRKERIIDTWAYLIDEACIDDGRQRAENFYKDFSTFLDATEAPRLRVERKHLPPSILRGISGDTREFLVLTDTTNYRMKPYQIYVSARPYGTGLATDWNLMYKPSPLMATLSLIPYVNLVPQTISDIDLFDQQDLRAYASNAHHCMLRAVIALMEYLHQDPSPLDRKSSGFLGVV
jgi:hypothetical protein